MDDKGLRRNGGTVVHFPGDGCPKCNTNILDAGGVKVIDWRIGRNGGLTKYQCSCGHTFWRYWPKVGEIDAGLRKQIAEHGGV